ncbi:Class I and II aminotransferase (fragment) [Cupriavidus necator]|uniref:Class I and II aminotransferase n=1 Tax=Cupriavidus necator TaxID=106590 RepID=A0A1K0JPH9_CUPNE
MTVTRLQSIPGIGVDRMADKADSMRNANSYLPFMGQQALREAAVERVRRLSGVTYGPDTECIPERIRLALIRATLSYENAARFWS